MTTISEDDDFDPTCGERLYRIGSNVTWDDGGDYWRIEIVSTFDGVGAVLIPAETMAAIVDEKTTDPARMAGLVTLFRDEIEREIAVCAMEHFEPAMGIIPMPRA